MANLIWGWEREKKTYNSVFSEGIASKEMGKEDQER